jgi:glutamyl-tRNA reductase
MPCHARAHTPQAGRTGSLLLGELSSIASLSVSTFQNAVERSSWSLVGMSGDGALVAAAVAAKDVHRMYIWTRLTGKLEVILEGVRLRRVIV